MHLSDILPETEATGFHFMKLSHTLISILLLFVCIDYAQAGRRVALVIGNGGYINAPALSSPKNDAEDIAAALKGLGFTVFLGIDLDKRGMDRKILEFANMLAGAEAGVFHYSGHGLQVAGVNYLVPVDAVLESAAALDFEMVRLDLLQRTMERETKTNILFLDACRNNPLSRNLARALGTRSMEIGRGLAFVESGAGTLISFSTQPGNVALDGEGRNSPYSGPLAKTLGVSGEDVLSMLTSVRNAVMAATGDRQVPWDNNALRAKFFFNPIAQQSANSGTEPPATAASQSPLSEAARAWTEIRETKSVAVLEAFRKQFAQSSPLYDMLAAERIEVLKPKVAVNAQNAPAISPLPPLQECDGLVVAVSMGKSPCIKPGSGVLFKDCADCPEMVIAPKGHFLMGSPESEPEREGWKARTETPQHDVNIERPFAVGAFAVTRDQFDVFVKSSGYKSTRGCRLAKVSGWSDDPTASYLSPGFEQAGSHPAVCVNWDDAKAYAVWLTKQTGQPYRLLSEVEREYATRAGTSTPFWWGFTSNPSQANYNGNAEVYKGGGDKGNYIRKTVPVRSYQPNPWGLYQVHGNVWDWVEECWHENYTGAPKDGLVWNGGDCSRRVVRGGSWFDPPRSLRAAYRDVSKPQLRSNVNGFRVARNLLP